MRQHFILPSGASATMYRLDTDASTYSPASLAAGRGGIPAIDSVLISDPTTGGLGGVWGPDDVALLWMKRLRYDGATAGDDPIPVTASSEAIVIPPGTVIPVSLAAPGTNITVRKSAGVWPARPTSRADIVVCWNGPEPSPPIVSTGTGGMLSDVDKREITS